jgi:hypothetical protein
VVFEVLMTVLRGRGPEAVGAEKLSVSV